MKSTKSRHKIKLKPKLKQVKTKKKKVEKKSDPELDQFMFVIQTYKLEIQKLIFKKYSSLSELEKIRNLLSVYYNVNNHFKNYCKLNQISYHFLNRQSIISKINW